MIRPRECMPTDAAGNVRAISAQPFPNNVIPSNRFNPVSVKMLEFFPRATRAGDDILNNYVRQRERPITWEQFNQRLDFLENVKSTWYGRFSWGDEDYKEIASFPDQEANILTRTKQVLASNIRSFGPSVVNEFRFGYTQFNNDQKRFYAGVRNVTAELGIIGLDSPVELSWGTPSIGLGTWPHQFWGAGQRSVRWTYVDLSMDRQHVRDTRKSLAPVWGRDTPRPL